jgi:hypothetical protein
MPDRREAGPHTVSAAPLIAWLDQRLADAGLTRTGDVEEQSVRPWATVLRVPASGGPLWLKATGPEMAFEAGLYELLVRVAPERVLTPIAVDVARGWILLPDGGPTLGDRLRGRELVEAVAHALPRYAELQRAVAPHVDELLAVGVPDMRPARMPERFEDALEAVRGRVDAKPFEALRPTVAEWCARLGGASVPASVDHNDLHAWNVLGAGDDVRSTTGATPRWRTRSRRCSRLAGSPWRRPTCCACATPISSRSAISPRIPTSWRSWSWRAGSGRSPAP